MKLVCEICFSLIGLVSEDVAVPLSPDMFTSFAPERQIPPPFHKSLTWEEFRCPYCRKRPIIRPDRIMTDHPRCFQSQGKAPAYQQLQPKPPEETSAEGSFRCPDCGKMYTSYQRFKTFHQCPELKEIDHGDE